MKTDVGGIETVDPSASSRFDLGTYWGRVRHFTDVTDPRSMFITATQLEQSRQITEMVAKRLGAPPPAPATPGSTVTGLQASDFPKGWRSVTPAQYWQARKVRAATLHPDTQQPIFLPFRFCAFVPTNLFTLLGMLHPSQQGPLPSMFWQWVNQTYNVGVNYSNRTIDVSATPAAGAAAGGASFWETLDRGLLTSYAIAVGASCGVALLGGRVLARAGSDRAPFLLKIGIPYAAVATANIANVAAMRSGDFLHGIKVRDAETGEELPGRSRVAGRVAVQQVATSRILLPAPLLLLPPAWMYFLFDSGRFPSLARRRPQLYLPVQLATILIMMTAALPMAIAVYPQDTVLPVTRLEPAYHSLHNDMGSAVTNVTFNKGL